MQRLSIIPGQSAQHLHSVVNDQGKLVKPQTR